MRAVSLFAVLVIAKALVLAGRQIPVSVWAPFVFFWQDVLAALIFLIVDRLLKRPTIGWALYAGAVVFVAINVPVAIVLGTPLTQAMMRAARGPLADSISHYVTRANVISMILVAGSGVLLPIAVKRWHVRSPVAVAGAAIVIVLIGTGADSRIETRGLERNAFGALLAASVTRLPVARAIAVDTDMHGRVERATEDLSYLRGAASGRNVVLIVLESTAARYLGLYGAAQDPMPVLTELGKRAVVFDAAYAVYPESIKGLFSTLCSRYPAFNTSPESHARAPCRSLAQSLRKTGYRTALFHSGRFEYLGMAPMIAGRGFEVLIDAAGIGGNARSSFGVDELSTVKRMLEWIDSLEAGEEFFAMYLPIAGHHPYASPRPGPFEGTGDFDRYRDALHYGDAALGEFLRGLHTRKLDDRTLFVVHGDHGEAFGQHPDNFAHTLYIYDENIRVPYVIAAPGLITEPIRTQRIASSLDTVPTILDLLGYAIPPEHQGRSLLEAEMHPAFFFTDYSRGWLGLRDSCWKYLYEIDSNRSKLFDLCRDPDELRDRSHEFNARVSAYRGRVQRWASAQQNDIKHGR